MAVLAITVGGTALPGGVVSIKRGDELLWSEGTGRSATTGVRVGSVVAAKQTWPVKWGVVSQADYNAIRAAVPGGFLSISIEVNGSVTSFNGYRGSITAEHIGTHGGTAYWKDLTIDFIER